VQGDLDFAPTLPDVLAAVGSKAKSALDCFINPLDPPSRGLRVKIQAGDLVPFFSSFLCVIGPCSGQPTLPPA